MERSTSSSHPRPKREPYLGCSVCGLEGPTVRPPSRAARLLVRGRARPRQGRRRERGGPVMPTSHLLLLLAGTSNVDGAAALTGSGSSTAAGVRTRSGAAALVGVGSTTTAGTRSRSAAATLTGTCDLAAAGVRARDG